VHIHKIKIRTVVSVVVPIIIIMTALTTLSYNSIKTVLINEAYSKLTTSRDIKKMQIEKFFSEVARDIEVIAKSKCIKSLVKILNSPNSVMMDYNAKDYRDFLLDYSKKYNYEDLLIISKNGIVQYRQRDKSKIGENLKKKTIKKSSLREAWERVKKSKETRFVDMKSNVFSSSRTRMFVATPIYIDDKFKSVLVFQISDSLLSEIMKFSTGYGYTQKDYLIGSDKTEYRNGSLCSLEHSVRVAISNQRIGYCDTEVNRKALCGQNGKEIV